MARRLLVLFGVLLCATSVHAQAPDALPGDTRAIDVPIVYSTADMIRNADVMLTASVLSVSVTDAALGRLSPLLFKGASAAARTSRIAKLVLFDAPVVTYFNGLNHEWGHQTSASEFGVRSRLSFVGTPWSGKPFDLVGGVIPVEPPAHAVVHGGGLEASRLLKDRSELRLLDVDRIAPGHALAAIVASLDAPVYAFFDLSPDNFSHEFVGDVLTIVRDLADRREAFDRRGIERIRHNVRARMAINLLDVALWSEAYGLLVDHVWNGDASARVRWLRIGNTRILPSLRYELSPHGPEYYAGTLFRAGGTAGRAYGRWTERIGNDRQVGGGAALSRWSIGRVMPRVTVDVWSHSADGFGMHAGIEADVNGWPGRRAALIVGAGAKSRGHLVGYSLDSGAYVTLGARMKIW